jgi:hypothetical protein
MSYRPSNLNRHYRFAALVTWHVGELYTYRVEGSLLITGELLHAMAIINHCYAKENNFTGFYDGISVVGICLCQVPSSEGGDAQLRSCHRQNEL